MKLSLLLYTLDIFQRKKLRKENQPLWAYILATTALPGCVIKESYQTSLGLHVQSVNMKANSTCLVGLLGGLRGQPVLRTFENAGHTVSTKPSPPIFCIGFGFGFCTPTGRGGAPPKSPGSVESCEDPGLTPRAWQQVRRRPPGPGSAGTTPDHQLPDGGRGVNRPGPRGAKTAHQPRSDTGCLKNPQNTSRRPSVLTIFLCGACRDATSLFLESKMVLSVKRPALHDLEHVANTANLRITRKAWENTRGLQTCCQAPSRDGHTGL